MQQGGLSYFDQGKGFNPHPTSRLGAVIEVLGLEVRSEVSILTQPRGWVQLMSFFFTSETGLVSILTQPLGWVQFLYLIFLFAHRESPVLCPPTAIFCEGMSWRLAILQIMSANL